MKICPSCSAINSEKDRVCKECGQSIKSDFYINLTEEELERQKAARQRKVARNLHGILLVILVLPYLTMMVLAYIKHQEFIPLAIVGIIIPVFAWFKIHKSKLVFKIDSRFNKKSKAEPTANYTETSRVMGCLMLAFSYIWIVVYCFFYG